MTVNKCPTFTNSLDQCWLTGTRREAALPPHSPRTDPRPASCGSRGLPVGPSVTSTQALSGCGRLYISNVCVDLATEPRTEALYYYKTKPSISLDFYFKIISITSKKVSVTDQLSTYS